LPRFVIKPRPPIIQEWEDKYGLGLKVKADKFCTACQKFIGPRFWGGDERAEIKCFDCYCKEELSLHPEKGV